MKILLATDGSEHSTAAASFLTRLDFQKDDEIAVLYAVAPTPVITEWESAYVDYRDLQVKLAPRILEPSVNILKALKAKITSSHVEGFPETAIVETAVESGADLIVVGASGARGISSFIIGSVAKHVAINSPKPVLVIKTPRKEAAGKLKILFATDGSGHSKAMARFLSSLPFPPDTEVTVLNVIYPVFADIPEKFVLEINDRIKKMSADTREAEIKASEKTLQETRETLKGTFRVMESIFRFGDPSDEILKSADELHSDVIVLGSKGMRGIKGMIGSVSRYVLNHSTCSVLVGKG